LQKLLIGDDFFNNYSEINLERIKQFNNKKNYYIPTLRSAHALFQEKDDTFSKIESDIFLDTLNRYYDLDKKNIEIFTGLHLYKSILNSRNSKRAVRQSFEKFEKFVGENFFGGKTEVGGFYDLNKIRVGLNGTYFLNVDSKQSGMKYNHKTYGILASIGYKI